MSRMESMTTFATASRSVARSCATPGSSGWASIGPSIPELAEQLYRMQHRQLPEGWEKDIPVFAADAKGVATRDASGKVLNAVAKTMPWLLGGSADLTPSCKTRMTFDGAGDFFPDSPAGRNLHFGIREHAMAAVLNGMALVKVRAYGSTFLIFSDYARGAIRLGADAVAGRLHLHTRLHWSRRGRPDAPADRATGIVARDPGPGRPAPRGRQRDGGGLEGRLAAEPRAGRSDPHSPAAADNRSQQICCCVGIGSRGLRPGRRPGRQPEVLLLASGSEVALCLESHERLKAEGIKSRVVSMPSWELFDDQPEEYRDRILPPEVTARVSVEQASKFGWAKYVGATGQSIGMRSFGASAPLKDLVKKFGFTPEHVVAAAKAQLRPSGQYSGAIQVTHDNY